ncbi:MAG: glycerophosphodiester phosphodiesterase [Cytophagales bacterium]|nr:glycerophosphodiester phosphodiesterase [Cytophagales bacterium]
MTLNFIPFLIIFSTIIGCSSLSTKKVDIQGHRGCRGLMPENTITAMIKAVEIGVNTLEMDVVISNDKMVLLSHEPFLSHEICLTPDGQEILEKDERSYNLYQMNYEEIKLCDCGTKIHPRFPDQKKLAALKPLLAKVIDTVEQYLQVHSLPAVWYNIETKCSPDGDGVFHPEPKEFIALLLDVLKGKNILDRTIIQSFDVRTLKVIKIKSPKMKLALLVENIQSPAENIKKLGFIPDVYSPYYLLVNDELMKYAQKNKMKVIPWTVNDKESIRKLIDMGVDGIITDYPDRAIE